MCAELRNEVSISIYHCASGNLASKLRNPDRRFDLIVMKSPHAEYHMYDAWVEKNFNIDAPGATSADVRSLGHTICARPMYPMELDTTFTPKAVTYAR